MSLDILLTTRETPLVALLPMNDAYLKLRGLTSKHLCFNLSAKEHFGGFIAALSTGDGQLELRKIYCLPQPSALKAWGSYEAINLTHTMGLNLIRMDLGKKSVYMLQGSPYATLMMNDELMNRWRADWTGVEQQSEAGAQARGQQTPCTPKHGPADTRLSQPALSC